MALRILQRLADHARQRPDAPALIDVESGEIWNWRQLHNATCYVSDQLSPGRLPGAAIILSSENEPAFVAAFLGILHAGLSVFCISPACAPAEMEALAVAASGRRLPIPFEQIRRARDFSAGLGGNEFRGEHQSALLLQSSGSTGPPKIVHRIAPTLDAISDAIGSAIGFRAGDHVLAAAPLCHSYGLEHGLLAPIWAGSCTHICRRFDVAAVLGQLSGAISIFPGVPFMFEALAACEVISPSLRCAYSAGGPLSTAVAQKFAARFGVPVGQVYGTTEIGSVTYTSDANAGVGRPLRDVSIDVDPQSGEVAIRSLWMFDGYLDDPDGNPPGYFRTGDIGRLDSDGNLFITGRLTLVIEIGGRKVNPLEVESVLADHPGVAQCAVVPLALAGTVTRLKALVIPRSPASPPAAADLRQFLKGRLASYKVPRVFELRRELPQSPTGKILRHLIDG